MTIKSVPFTLKDGRPALLRSPRETDTEEMLRYLRTTAQETEFITRYPEECDTFYTYDIEKRFIAHTNASATDAMIVCETEGRIAGTCNISFGKYMKTRHRATIGIVLLREFWGLGIGRKMFEEMTRLAESREEVMQLELGFVEGNTRARALYEKMGFRLYGMNPNAFRLKDGTLRNEYLMIKTIR